MVRAPWLLVWVVTLYSWWPVLSTTAGALLLLVVVVVVVTCTLYGARVTSASGHRSSGQGSLSSHL